MSDELQKSNESEFLFYTSEDGAVKIEVFFAGENIWLTQAKMAELFCVDRSVISKHLSNIFDSRELLESSNVQKVHVAHSTKPVSHYSLDAIISVGYRVNSVQATRFRIWATATLREYLLKGFVLDDERLKNGTHFGKDYFDELLEKVREIRTSERRFYQKIADIYATASDYDPRSRITKDFYATVQNKLHWAIHGKTAAELIAANVSSEKPNMGLTTWKNAPKGKILKSDVTIAKNYLAREHLQELERVVSMYLDFAENQANRGRIMTMANWIAKLDSFLQFNEYEILTRSGKLSNAVAKSLAEEQYEAFRLIQDREFVSDFDHAASNALKAKDRRNE